MLCARRKSISSRVMTATEPGVDMIGESVLVAPEARLATNPLVPALTRSAVDTIAGLGCDCAEGLPACRVRREGSPLREAVLRCGAARCAFGLGASTVTAGNAEDCVAVCASAGEPVARRAPSASKLAELVSKFGREREITRRVRSCALHSMSVPHPERLRGRFLLASRDARVAESLCCSEACVERPRT